MSHGYLALGGNLGDRRATLQAAVDALPAAGITPLACSSVYATAAVGGPAGQPDYLNACLRIATELSPPALLEACKAIERALGRPAPGEPGYVDQGPRPVDLDVLLLGDEPFESEHLTIPHPRMRGRRFVLIPLLELDFDVALPGGERLADDLARLPVDEDVRRDGPPLRLPAPSVWAVVPVHDGVEHTLGFLASMERQTYEHVRVVLVDDGSTDGTAERVAAAFPEVEVVPGDGTLWWSGATNRGVLHALARGADHVLTINNDLELDPRAIGALVAAAAARPHALIGAMVRSDAPPHEVVFSGATFAGGDLPPPGAGEEGRLRPSDWLIGMGVLVPVGVFADVGLYDEVRFPQYYGDNDFSLRAREHGWELLVCPGAVLYSDVESNWLGRQRADPRLRFYADVFFSTRSFFHVGTSYRYHRRHHPDPSRRTWLRGYSASVWKTLVYVAYLWGRKRLLAFRTACL